jgi:hypothetical protein
MPPILQELRGVAVARDRSFLLEELGRVMDLLVVFP